MDIYLTFVLGFIQLGIVLVNGQDSLCNDRLIQSLPDDHLTATSSRGDPIATTSPARGRLNETEVLLANGTTLMGGWSPATDKQNHYLQATFDHMTMINEILTQGRHQGNGHVTMYKIEYTEDGNTWQILNDAIGVERGNADSDTIQANTLDCPIFAKGIRIIPLDWDTHVALRFDVTGCYVDNAVTVTTTTPMVSSANSTSAANSASPYTPTTTHTIVTTLATTPTTTVKTTPMLSMTTTTVKTTTMPTTSTTKLTTIKTTRKTTQKPTTAATTKRATMTPTTLKTTPSTRTTTPYMFLPGIQNPFGTTKKSTIVTTKKVPLTVTSAPFQPGIPDPFGPGQLIG